MNNKQLNKLPMKTPPPSPPETILTRVPGRSPEWKSHINMGMAISAVKDKKLFKGYGTYGGVWENNPDNEIWIFEDGEWQYIDWSDEA